MAFILRLSVLLALCYLMAGCDTPTDGVRDSEDDGRIEVA